jgi:D-glycero-alpha-D-manno-heptose-7-phosphate kinase
MIITRTPYRISFFGGGTDYPAWYLREGGVVLSTTIDKYCYLSCRYLPPFFRERHRVVWSYIENVQTISEILHPAVREGLRHLGFDDSMGVEICHQGDLPARSGIGSSSSFTVGLIKGLTALKGQMIGKHELALKAIELEQKVLKENVGSQDQVAAAYGGFNLIRFASNGLIQVEPVTVPPERIRELEDHLLMVYTGSARMGAEIAGEVIAQIPNKTAHLSRMRETVDEAVGILAGKGPLEGFGRLLHEFWLLKRSLAANVSNADVDELYETAQRHGALGGKLLGAGSKGFMVFFVPPERHCEVKEALRRYLYVPFRFEYEGSVCVYYAPSGSALSGSAQPR